MKSTAPLERASKASWTAAALVALSRGGVEAVSVEPLAKVMGVTKGSFYWHFENRDALLAAALSLWEQRGTKDIITSLERIASPAERLAMLFRNVSGAKGEPAHAALSSASEPSVKKTLERVATMRLDFLSRCYRELGMRPRTARTRAQLAYSAYLGMLQLMRDSPSELAVPAERKAYVEHVIETLVTTRL
jgi:AcrR family transcriptional regulator